MTLPEQLATLEHDAVEALHAARDAAELHKIEKQYLGRKGQLAELLSRVAAAPPTERPSLGKQGNAAKKAIEQAVAERRASLAAGQASSPEDLSLPAIPQELGHRHPLMVMRQRMTDIFARMGYEVQDGPEIELAKYNFDLLNIPENHPARDVWDTFYVEGGPSARGPNTPLLRTHVSALQLRVMGKRKPPVRFVAPGRIFRHEATDMTHEANFFQFDGLAIEQGLTFGNLLGTIETFFRALFGNDVEIRAQPSYFPFVEPGAEVLMKGHHGWMEMLGCGMVHPAVLKHMGINPRQYSGFAFGMGIDRLMMYYYNVPDVRLSYSGDLRFLQQF